MSSRVFAVIALTIAFSSSAYAQFEGPSKSGTTATVAQANDLRVGSYVTITGNVIEHLRDEYFTFRDQSGSIRTEIPRNVFRGQAVSPTTSVRITGEIDRGRAGRYIYVKALDVIKP